jgi:repressor LexA
MPDIYQERKAKLLKFYQKHHHLPSYGDLVGLFGLKSKGSVYCYVDNFIKEGVLKKNEKGQLVATSKLFGLRVLGTVKAGFPSPAEEELVDTISLDEYLLNNPTSSYLLKVSGDSMQDAGIVEGDIVIIDKSLNPKTNDIVVAEVDNDWTMKYFIKSGNKILLRAGNKKYKDIHPEESLKIAGVVISVVRKYH